MADEQVEYHVSIAITKITTVSDRAISEFLTEEKWPHMAATFPNEEDAIDCANVMKGFLLGM